MNKVSENSLSLLLKYLKNEYDLDVCFLKNEVKINKNCEVAYCGNGEMRVNPIMPDIPCWVKSITKENIVTFRGVTKETSTLKNAYEIWSEGFCVTGQQSKARLVATVNADSFQQACDKFYKNNEYYKSKNLSYWGCGLFDNEVDARKGFG